MREAGALLAREMLLEAAVLGADQMQARGFLSRVVPEGQSAGESEAAVARISALSPQAARLNKQTLRVLLQSAGPGDPAADLTERFQSQAYGYADSADHREGIGAFLEKRKADF